MNTDDLIPTRISLLKRLRNWDDQESWQDFFNIYWKFIYHLATRQGLSDAEAQDVVQETVVTVARKIHDFRLDPNTGSFKAWLVHTTRWRIADQYRKRARHPEANHRNDEESERTATIERISDEAKSDMESTWERDWERNLLEVALEKIRDKVSSDAYQMFYLHMVKQWPAKKVAATVGAKLPQIYFVKYKVYRMVKREVERLKRELI